VLVFKWVDNASMVGLVLKLTGYTYGPLLGLFAFGMLTRRACATAGCRWWRWPVRSCAM
jgi:hypothetical protein